ncbi:MAG: hypothetical protein GW762_06075 [Candidatus Pacebacteria bacterium]|nr:hypothetical protein [Candidatus Paceibacterota bacterium]PIR64189.1 MAG: hypothetical protein COU64_00535 [Candidatus Pacebacteria bacterium CG10_big_fil_rev_8_21_14_0_10_40_26]PIZ79287.1 MAG: hypothetical protein COY01_02585 [Candidatus Pacebacteria bacterium CG_4_10_14_0_2_um_filter_40_20]PJA68943.1 MAG: hypothetical protein CO156_03195 [Candidatus Pacebacteria bacterium CG_4_9_14_3_um_filter_40_12]PJC42254.1 MAG: hypothetical protein CO041_01295 [Candidatus Pacebacteria bacterium CG_4_9_
MLDQAQLNTIRSYFEQAHTVTIVCGVEPSIDVLAAVSVLNQALASQGKEIQLVSPNTIDSPVVSGLGGVEDSIGNQNLVVSFPYDETAVDKVSYHIGEDSGQFFLTIKPKKGHDPLDSNQVEFTYAGVESDLLVLVGVTNFDELNQLYVGYEEFFEKTPKISFTANGSKLGNVNISSTGYSSISECLLVLLNSLQIDFSVDSATNLFSAIDVETDYMRSLKASAITFEAVAQLMRLGARRVRPEKLQKQDVGQKVSTRPLQETEIAISSSKSQKKQDSLTEQQNQSKKMKLKKHKQSLPKDTRNQPGGLKYDPSNGISRN